MLNKQRGAAIIVALFVTALIAIAAIAMIERLRMDLRQTELTQHAESMQLLAQGSIAWAVVQLNQNWKQKKPNTVVDNTPIQSPIDEVDNATINSIILDQEGLYNINNLTSPDQEESFIRLLREVDSELSIEEAHTITNAVRDWVSTGDTKNSLTDYYLKQNPPYQAPHRPMVSISELRLVRGITPDLFNALAPHVTALPENTKVNINNASIPVLMSLSSTLSKDSAAAILAQRKKKPFPDIQRFLEFDIIKNNPIEESKITAISSYFLIKTNVKVNHQETTLYTLIHRELKNSEPIEVILWQSKGTL